MKVKLLKKVRKKFVIEKINKLGSNPEPYLLEFKYKLREPFYVIRSVNADEGGDFDFLYSYFDAAQNLKEAKDILLKFILDKYSEKYRHKDTEKEKVWYNF